MDMVESAVKSLRSLRLLMPAKERHERREAFALCRTDAVAEIIKSHEREISTLATISSLKFLRETDAAPAGWAVSVVNETLSVYLKLQEILNAEAECEKLRKKMEEIQKCFFSTETLQYPIKDWTRRQAATLFWPTVVCISDIWQRYQATGQPNKDDDSSGYQEKVPTHIHEENVAKPSMLMQEHLSLEETSQHLEREIAEGSANDN